MDDHDSEDQTMPMHEVDGGRIDRRTMIAAAGALVGSGGLLAATQGLASPTVAQQMIPATITRSLSERVADVRVIGNGARLSVETARNAFIVDDGRAGAGLDDYATGELVMLEVEGSLPPGEQLGHGEPHRREGRISVESASPFVLGDISELEGRR